ncbi:unnamed protein product [Didymodactylos carnosus]|uniref:Uncharacterized protein n=1 Tax=Didymodactylos carnosus TaxID=1234261 RepID=A0A816AM02_9BILA|nr:unnamed protein product [Didymodactylos carnosus]CAF4475832.1 unnamed protein product [Didymodactylos carnosus]
MILMKDAVTNTTLQTAANFIAHSVTIAKRFEELPSVVGSFKERVLILAIDDFPVAGSIREFIDVLLNNDVIECVKILEKYEIDWPFKAPNTTEKLAQFLVDYGAAKGFNKQQVIAKLKKYCC